MLEAADHNPDNNCGNWSKPGRVIEILLFLVLTHRVHPDKQAEYSTVTECLEKHVKETSIMPRDEEEDTTVYTVVVNHEEQYSIWPKRKAIPQGWKAVGKEGLKPECLQYVDEVWTDMRPLSLRKTMEGQPLQQSGCR
jgi:MbtH protein